VMQQLAATLLSLWQIGVARCVVIGRTEEKPAIVEVCTFLFLRSWFVVLDS